MRFTTREKAGWVREERLKSFNLLDVLFPSALPPISPVCSAPSSTMPSNQELWWGEIGNRGLRLVFERGEGTDHILLSPPHSPTPIHGIVTMAVGGWGWGGSFFYFLLVFTPDEDEGGN